MTADAARDLYLELLKHCVSNYIYDDDVDLTQGGSARVATGNPVDAHHPAAVDPRLKYYGAMWPSRAHTMVGIPRLDNIRQCVEEVLAAGIPGDLIETGVWRGGASIFMRGILKAHGVKDRVVWVADSFAGLPPADFAKYPQESSAQFERHAELAIPLDEVQRNFGRYGLLDDQTRFLKGWFRDTLPSAPIGSLALMRLDGDMYESTMDALMHLYPKLSRGGFVIIDDYNVVPACNAAVEDFRKAQGIAGEIFLIPACGAYWRK